MRGLRLGTRVRIRRRPHLFGTVTSRIHHIYPAVPDSYRVRLDGKASDSPWKREELVRYTITAQAKLMLAQ